MNAKASKPVGSVARRSAKGSPILSFGGDNRVEIVIVVPVYRHSVFLTDSVLSAVLQITSREFRVVIVNDGCPHPETERVAVALAVTYPGRIEYIRRANGGLSAARNSGINYALRRWPSLWAIYFLDADNFIEPYTIDRGAAALISSDANVGWVYPDISMFGSDNNYYDYSGPYSVLLHLAENISEAGSMVHRRVLDKGCRFDENMRSGYEDWEFWWQCIEAGFVGRHVAHFGLRYRKRPESMLSDAERDDAAVRSYMRRKHSHLFRAKNLLRIESADMPRFAILLEEEVAVFTDVRHIEQRESLNIMVQRCVASRQRPDLSFAPRLIGTASGQCLELLAVLRLDRFVLWWLEQQVSRDIGVHVAAIQIVLSPSGQGVVLKTSKLGFWPAMGAGIHLLMIEPSVLDASLANPKVDWMHSLLSATAEPTAVVLRIELSSELLRDRQCPDVIYRWYDFFKKLHMAVHAPSPRWPEAKKRTVAPISKKVAIADELMESGPLYPLIDSPKRDIAFVLPLVSFGGVEKVALCIAEEFSKAGWRCHLVVLANEAAVDRHWLSVFDTVNFYYHDDLNAYSEALQYLGTTYPRWITGGNTRVLEGLLLPMDAVINFHCPALHKVAGKLRRSGIATVASLHLIDLSPVGREVGHPFLTLGYEYAYDFIALCSQTLLEWCHALGIPHDKLVLVPNAPSYQLTSKQIRSSLRLRRSGQKERIHLRVLFLGRFDRQKGIDRVAAAVKMCRELKLPITWRVVGGSVIEQEDKLLTNALQDVAEPPIRDAAEITRIFEWADVLFLPSHWEGLPLTILEGARLGVIPVAANVGAISEVVATGQTGILIDDDADADRFAAAAVKTLSNLANDAQLRARLSKQAAKAMTRNWTSSCDGLIARFAAIVSERGQSPSNLLDHSESEISD